jgi:hypothetical protein
MKYKIKQCWDCGCVSLIRNDGVVVCKWCHLNMDEKKINKILSQYGHSSIVSAKQDRNARKELRNAGFNIV